MLRLSPYLLVISAFGHWFFSIKIINCNLNCMYFFALKVPFEGQNVSTCCLFSKKSNTIRSMTLDCVQTTLNNCTKVDTCYDTEH